VAEDYARGEGGARWGRCENCGRGTFVVEATHVRSMPPRFWLMTDREIPELHTTRLTVCKPCVKLLTEGRHTGVSIGTKKKGD